MTNRFAALESLDIMMTMMMMMISKEFEKRLERL